MAQSIVYYYLLNATTFYFVPLINFVAAIFKKLEENRRD